MTGANTVDGAAGACGRGERLKRERHEARYRRSGRILFSFLGSSALSASLTPPRPSPLLPSLLV